MAETLTLDATGGPIISPSQKSAADKSIVLTVANMNCGGCMRKVEDALGAVSGVASARVNLAAKRVTATISDAAIEPHDLIEVLDKAGFRSAVIIGNDDVAIARSEHDLLVRMAVAGFAAANVMLLSISVWSGQAGGDMTGSQTSLFHLLSAMIALPTVVYAGMPFFKSAFSALKVGRLNMDVPISLGVLLATGMSVYQTFFGDGYVYFDAAVMLLFFLLIGRFLDTRIRRRASGAASDLLAFRALSADVISPDGTLQRLPAAALEPGMKIQVAPGNRIAVDGTITAGTSDLDNSIITGESTPQSVSAGDEVFAGAVNLGARITVTARAVEDNTVLSEIARLMATAEQNRSRYVRLADRAAKIYAPAVHLLGLATFLGWVALGFGWEPALTAA
ncbi:MAG: heavy metal translocating P-type ATPase, partial [Pseudomonadota bacterium]